MGNDLVQFVGPAAICFNGDRNLQGARLALGLLQEPLVEDLRAVREVGTNLRVRARPEICLCQVTCVYLAFHHSIPFKSASLVAGLATTGIEPTCLAFRFAQALSATCRADSLRSSGVLRGFTRG